MNESINPLKVATEIYEEHLELAEENMCDGYKDVAKKAAKITILKAQSMAYSFAPLQVQEFWDSVVYELENLF